MNHSTLTRLLTLGVVAALASACCFLHSFHRQNTRPLTYRTHGGIPAAWITPINSAATTWNGVYNLFTYGGGGGGPTYVNDGINSIFRFTFTNPNVLAAVGFPGSTTCGLTDTDMGWSTGHTFSTTGAQYDVQTVALHEFGHYGILLHVSCPRSAVMYPSYSGVRRNLTGCDAFGMWVSNVLPSCFPAMGICFPSFFSFALNAFDRLDQQAQQVVGPFEEHTDELLQIWDGDTTLQAASDSVGEFYANLALDFDNGHNSPYEQVFTQARYNEIDSQIIGRVYASSSYPLRGDLDALRAHLQSKIGLNFGQIFGGDLDQYPGNPGQPIEPDPPSGCTSCGGGGGGGEPCPGDQICPVEPQME